MRHHRDDDRMANLVEEVVRRVLTQFKERLVRTDHHHPVALDETIEALPAIVRDSVESLSLKRARARPHPGAKVLRKQHGPVE